MPGYGVTTSPRPSGEITSDLTASGLSRMASSSSGLGRGVVNWFCYLLRCADDTLYCGITNDLEKRHAAHNAGTASKYTRTRVPVELVYAESCADRSAASQR